MKPIYLEQAQINTYQTEGVTIIRGLFKDWVHVIEAGIERNIESPGTYASENLEED